MTSLIALLIVGGPKTTDSVMGSYDFHFVSLKNHLAATGTLNINRLVSDKNGTRTYSGVKKMKLEKEFDTFGQFTSSRPVTIVVRGNKVTMEWNPGVADFGVSTKGTLGNQGFAGKWGASTFSGYKEIGTFTGTRRAKK